MACRPDTWTVDHFTGTDVSDSDGVENAAGTYRDEWV